jgi:plastocyanin
MRVINKIAVATLAIAALMLGSTTTVAQDREHCGNHTIQVRPGPDGGVELTYKGGSGDEVRVCPGDSVSWVLTGSDRTFFVDFFSGAPFAGAQRRGNNSMLEITIDAESGSYNYDVGWDGEDGMDPVIIVD